MYKKDVEFRQMPKVFLNRVYHLRILKNCPKFRITYLKNIHKNSRVNMVLGIQLPTSYYRYAPSKCWKCKKDIILYTYPGCNQGIGDVAPDPTHEPIPSTLKKLFLWNNWQYANVCPHCENTTREFLHIPRT